MTKEEEQELARRARLAYFDMKAPLVLGGHQPETIAAACCMLLGEMLCECFPTHAHQRQVALKKISKDILKHSNLAAAEFAARTAETMRQVAEVQREAADVARLKMLSEGVATREEISAHIEATGKVFEGMGESIADAEREAAQQRPVEISKIVAATVAKHRKENPDHG